MIIAFQILLFILIIFFGLGTLSYDSYENKVNYTSVTIAAIIAMMVTFFVG